MICLSEDQQFLREQEWTELRLHKNVSYRPSEDILRGVSGKAETVARLHTIMRNYSAQIIQFVGNFLSPYSGKWNLDFASFRPLEEENRDLPVHKRNDLLHVDAFPEPADARWTHLACVHEFEHRASAGVDHHGKFRRAGAAIRESRRAAANRRRRFVSRAHGPEPGSEAGNSAR